MAHSVEESGARLVMVLGHTQCSAIDGAVDRWLEKKASAWPWPSKAPQQGDVRRLCQRGSLRPDVTIPAIVHTHRHAFESPQTMKPSEDLCMASALCSVSERCAFRSLSRLEKFV